MSVQSIGSNNQTQNTTMTDFTNLRTDINTLQSAMNLGDQDQVTLSESALATSLSQVESDLSSMKGSGHHHHHMSADANNSGDSSTNGSSVTSSSYNTTYGDMLLQQVLSMLNSGVNSTSGGNSASSLAQLLGTLHGNAASLAALLDMTNNELSQSNTAGINALT